MRSGGFPWTEHRTLSEVDETEELRRIAHDANAGVGGKLSKTQWGRLEDLTAKERAHNPPHPLEPRGAA